MYGCSNVCPYQLLTSPIPGRWSLADSRQPREEPSAGNPLARICEGDAEWLNYSTITCSFISRVYGALANSLFHHRPQENSNPPSKIETAYYQADHAIQKLIDLLAA